LNSRGIKFDLLEIIKFNFAVHPSKITFPLYFLISATMLMKSEIQFVTCVSIKISSQQKIKK
jgi:hypothetical protein